MSNQVAETQPVTKKKRGRPRKPFALVRVDICLSPRTYDAYCKVAQRADLPLAVVLRHVLTLHAPGKASVEDFRASQK